MDAANTYRSGTDEAVERNTLPLDGIDQYGTRKSCAQVWLDAANQQRVILYNNLKERPSRNWPVKEGELLVLQEKKGQIFSSWVERTTLVIPDGHTVHDAIFHFDQGPPPSHKFIVAFKQKGANYLLCYFYDLPNPTPSPLAKIPSDSVLSHLCIHGNLCFYEYKNRSAELRGCPQCLPALASPPTAI